MKSFLSSIHFLCTILPAYIFNPDILNGLQINRNIEECLYFLRMFSLRMPVKGKSSSAGIFFLNCSHTSDTFTSFPVTQPRKRKQWSGENLFPLNTLAFGICRIRLGVLVKQSQTLNTHTWGWSLFTGSTSGSQRQWLWAAVPFTFTIRTLDVVLFMIHFHP